MKVRNLRNIVIWFVAAFVLFNLVGFAYLWVIGTPTAQSDHYFTISTVGPTGLANDYYPAATGNRPIINVGEQVSWDVQVYNHMGYAQWVAIRLKLTNQTVAGPSDLNATPNTSPVIYQYTHLLNANETWSFPLTWSITKVSHFSGNTLITGLLINKTQLVNVSSEARAGINFRMVIELWNFNSTLQDFQFPWYSDGRLSTSWNQIWFNSTS
jgi:hypothetical protein